MRRSEQGSALVALIFGLTGVLVLGFGFLAGAFLLVGSIAGASSPLAPIGADVGRDVADVPSSNSVDLNQGGLVCLSLPGVKGTPTLDRRVAPKLFDALREIREEKMAQLTFNWMFRTNCQQSQIKSTYGPKAPVNASMHEAGAAVDVNGMTSRPDRYKVVHIFERHGWRWLGMGRRPDPPHFEIQPWVVGEPSKYEMIRRAQDAYERGQIDGGCKGSPCSMN